MESIVFYVAAGVAVVSAVVAMAHRNPVVNVLALIVTFFCVAVNYALLGAGFLAAAQILVYAGAILVLFLFVVMLLNAPEVRTPDRPRPIQKVVGIALAGAAAVGGLVLVASVRLAAAQQPVQGTAEAVGRQLLGRHLFAFELVTVLLLVALVGALVLVKRKH